MWKLSERGADWREAAGRLERAADPAADLARLARSLGRGGGPGRGQWEVAGPPGEFLLLDRETEDRFV